MKLLFVILKKHGTVDIVSYTYLLNGDFLDNGMTIHVHTYIIVQFAQKYN